MTKPAIKYLASIMLGLMVNMAHLVMASHTVSGINIEYMQPSPLRIGAHGANRLDFGYNRIIKIVGNSSEYGAIISDNGGNLFITSKLGAGSIIDLALLMAGGEVVDLRLYVSDISPVILKLDTAGLKSKEAEMQKEIKAMIGKMAEGGKGKYYVSKIKRQIQIPGRPDIMLEQNQVYQYGDLVGASFKYSVQKSNNRNKDTTNVPALTKEELQGLFKNVLAIATKGGNVSVGQNNLVLMVFKSGEGLDV